MKIKTSELEGAALDWAVAKAVCPASFKDSFDPATGLPHWSKGWLRNGSPSTDWSQGGPLIDRYRIDFRTQAGGCRVIPWAAHEPGPSEGPSHLIAACRAIVRIELGSEVDVPDELA